MHFDQQLDIISDRLPNGFHLGDGIPLRLGCDEQSLVTEGIALWRGQTRIHVAPRTFVPREALAMASISVIFIE